MYSPQVKKLYQTGLLAFTCSQTLMFITNAESLFSYHAEQMEFQGQRKSFEPKKFLEIVQFLRRKKSYLYQEM